MLSRTKIVLAAAIILSVVGEAQASTAVAAFIVAQASTGSAVIGRPAVTNTFSAQRPSLGTPSGRNPNNPQDMINRSNPQDRTPPNARNPQDLTR